MRGAPSHKAKKNLANGIVPCQNSTIPQLFIVDHTLHLKMTRNGWHTNDHVFCGYSKKSLIKILQNFFFPFMKGDHSHVCYQQHSTTIRCWIIIIIIIRRRRRRKRRKTRKDKKADNNAIYKSKKINPSAYIHHNSGLVKIINNPCPFIKDCCVHLRVIFSRKRFVLLLVLWIQHKKQLWKEEVACCVMNMEVA